MSLVDTLGQYGYAYMKKNLFVPLITGINFERETFAKHDTTEFARFPVITNFHAKISFTVMYTTKTHELNTMMIRKLEKIFTNTRIKIWKIY